MLFLQQLGIDYKCMFENVNRLGRYQGGGRPIVVRFLHFCDLQYVLDNADGTLDTALNNMLLKRLRTGDERYILL